MGLNKTLPSQNVFLFFGRVFFQHREASLGGGASGWLDQGSLLRPRNNVLPSQKGFLYFARVFFQPWEAASGGVGSGMLH